MKDDIRRAFDGITEEPHPSLRASVRARVAGGPVRAQSPAWRLAAAVAVVVIVALAGYAGLQALLLSHGSGGTGLAGVPTPSPTATPSQEATPSPSPTPAVSPSPSASVYLCGSAQAGSWGNQSNVTGVRVGTGPGYDRFVIEFDGPVPAVDVAPQSAPTFNQGASGQQVVILGQSGILVTVNHTSAATTYSGPTDFKPGYPVLAEARQTQDFERVYSWGLGLNLPPRTSCIHVYTLTGPDRVVIDIQQP